MENNQQGILPQEATLHVVRDVPTKGCDFFLWGVNDVQAAQISLEDARNSGCDVELVSMPLSEIDPHTRALIGDQEIFPPSGDRAATQQDAERAGYKVHQGTEKDGSLNGRWWWTLTRPGWGGVETAPNDWGTEGAAWADAIAQLGLGDDPIENTEIQTESVELPLEQFETVQVLVLNRAEQFQNEPTFTAPMRAARLEQAMKAWNVADDSDDGEPSTPDLFALEGLLADARHYCDAHGLDFGAIDRAAYTNYCEQLDNDRHCRAMATASSQDVSE